MNRDCHLLYAPLVSVVSAKSLHDKMARLGMDTDKMSKKEGNSFYGYH